MTERDQSFCKQSVLQTSTTLSSLINSGYSPYYAIQLDLDGIFAEPEFYVFDEEDRRNWGNTMMFRGDIVLGDDQPPVAGYVSDGIDSLFRLICLEPAYVRSIRDDPDELLRIYFGRNAPLTPT